MVRLSNARQMSVRSVQRGPTPLCAWVNDRGLIAARAQDGTGQVTRHPSSSAVGATSGAVFSAHLARAQRCACLEGRWWARPGSRLVHKIGLPVASLHSSNTKGVASASRYPVQLPSTRTASRRQWPRSAAARWPRSQWPPCSALRHRLTRSCRVAHQLRHCLHQPAPRTPLLRGRTR